MCDACIFQYGDGEYRGMLDVTHSLHVDYAQRHNMDLVTAYLGDHPQHAWWRWHMVSDLLRRYRYVFCIDADAAVVGGEDLRCAVEDRPIAAVWGGMIDEPEHYNVGVTYWRNDAASLHLLDQLLSYEPDESTTADPWYRGDGRRIIDQWTANELMQGAFYHDVTALPARWNSTNLYTEVDDPVVMAWHSIMPLRERMTRMQHARERGWTWHN